MKKASLCLTILLVLTFYSCRKKPVFSYDEDGFSTALTETEIKKGILTPELLWKFGRISDHQLSPDRENLLFNVTRYNYKTDESITEIYSLPADGGEARRVNARGQDCYNPRWKPDGTAIGYISDVSGESQLWEISVGNSENKQISEIDGGIIAFEYSPDGERILYTKEVKLDETTGEKYQDLPLANVRIIDDLMYRHWNSWHDYKYSHIFVANLTGKGLSKGKDIMEGEKWDAPLSPYFDQTEISWSPDGRYIAYTSKKMKGKEYALSTNSDIYLYDVREETTRNLTRGFEGYDKYPSFSNDSRMLAWQSMETPGYESDKDRLFIMDLETGEKRNLSKNFDQDAENLTWSDDDSKIYFISGTEATYQIYSVELESAEIRRITEGNHDYTSIRLGDGFLTGEKMSMSMATEIFRIDISSGEEIQLSHVNKNIYDNITMGKVESRWITTTDNKQMKVWIIYPPGFDPSRKYPALLYCQGGPQSAVSQFFSYRWNFQLMAANGYIVVAPNRRGLPTFGSEWNEQISGDYGGQNIKDYLSAIDAVKVEEFVDEDNLGAVGASYGGYSVFYLAGHHDDRFNAFISHCGIFNFESMYASTEEMFFVNHDLEGPYWDTPRPRSYDFSPHLFVKNWNTPIMIITGEYDFRIPYTQSLQAFNAAQLNNVPSKLLVFPEESHFVLKPQNSILWHREFFSWLDKYLK